MLKNLTFGVLILLSLLAVAPASVRADSGLNWSGVVDDKLEIVVRGRNVFYRNITGDRPQNINADMDGRLPARNVDVRLDRRNGRGSIDIIERPNRNNGYAAIVRINDPQAGAARYNFTLRWNDNGDGGGNGGSGGNWGGGNNGGNNGGGWDNNVGNNAIRWSGRVDGVNDVRIQGNNVKWFKVEGRGAWDVNYRVGDRLPNAQTNVRIDKRRGRGSVYILTPPGRQNNYTLTIRVVDKDSGDDFYDFTARW